MQNAEDTPDNSKGQVRKIGRPRKTAVEAARKPGKPGRPKGEAGIMQDYKARMLASPKSRKVIDAIFEAALDKDHKNQAAAWKLIIDRIAPVSIFEQDVQSGKAKGGITINITGIGGNVQIDEALEAEYEEVKED